MGVLTGITDLCQRHGIKPSEIQQFYHGTTIATNALLEYQGARVGVVTTKGYRDILHIGRHQRPHHYSIQGGAGFPGKLTLKTSTGEEIPLPSKVPYRSVKTGDLFIAVGATGGRYGDPLQRDPHQVLEDVRDGYYSVATAERDYGVIITELLQLDEAATVACRCKRKTAMSDHETVKG